MRGKLFLRLLTLLTICTSLFTAHAQTASPAAAACPNAKISASKAARILEQATWGPTATSICQLQQEGFDTWFTNQVSPSTAPLTTYSNQLMTVPATGLTNFDISPTQIQFLQAALNNPDQLRQRVAFALSQIWVVSHVEVARAQAFPPLLNVFEKDAFGTYSQLINDITLNAGMGQMLNMVNNVKAVPPAFPNENYARELMQLFTLGLNVLNPDGTLALNSQGQPIATYDPTNTVSALAAAFTGWTYAADETGSQAPYCAAPNLCDPMVQASISRHDTSAKNIVFTYPPSAGHPDGTPVTLSLPAGQTAAQDLANVINGVNGAAGLMQNPTLAPFVSQQLIQHLVTSNPSSAYVNRIANVFTDSGGNLQSVVYAILTDVEAREGDAGITSESAAFGHLREPILLLANVLRGLNGQIQNSSTLFAYLNNLAEEPLDAPSVFSFFSPQNGVGSYEGQALLGPEFQIYSTQTAVTGNNYLHNAIYLGKLDAGTTLDITEFVNAASSGTLKTLINSRFFHGAMSSTLSSAIDTALTGVTDPTAQAQDALWIALSSSEFLIIH